jgi:Transcriptional regulators
MKNMDREEFAKVAEDILSAMSETSRLTRWWQKNAQFSCKPIELTPLQLHAVVTVKRYAPLNMTQLAEYLIMPRQQLTKIVDDLVKKKFLVREASPENRRNVIIRFSQFGEEQMGEVIQSIYETVSALEDRLGEEQLRELFFCFRRVQEILQGVAGGNV